MFTAVLENIAFSASSDVFELVNSANCAVRLHSFRLTSNKTTAEILRVQLLRRTTTGSGGAALTARALHEPDSAQITSITRSVGTPGTGGDVLDAWQWEQLGPLEFRPTPAEMPIVAVSGRICVFLPAAPGSSSNLSGKIVWEELG